MKKVLFPAFDNGFLQLVTEQRSCDLNKLCCWGLTHGRELPSSWEQFVLCRKFQIIPPVTERGYSIVNILKHSMVPHLFVYPCCYGNCLLFTGCSDKETVTKPCYCQAQVKSEHLYQRLSMWHMSTDIQTKINMTNIYLKRMKNKLKKWLCNLDCKATLH